MRMDLQANPIAVSAEAWMDALARARAHAPFLRHALDRQPQLEELLRSGDAAAALEWAQAAGSTIDDAAIALRRQRLALAATLAIGDLAGAFPLALVMQRLSAFADHALDRAISDAITRRVEDAEPVGMSGIALGKHGAGELNYSSDIDPILLYDPDTLPRRTRDEPGEAAQRYARDVVQMLSSVTADGYVFRVDLRLRPASEVSPLAISFGAALSHYESSALAWERAAYIRARAASGDCAAGQQFLAQITPFVWRRSLDFQAITEISRLTARIRQTYKGPLTPSPGFNVKQGRGGIREVEFFAQTHQLIHGGRDPSLRLRGTRAALDALAQAGIIQALDAQELGEAYDRLRVIEHRLQMVDDHQTHTLPSGDALDNVALLGGYAGAEALLADLGTITALVADRFDRLIDAEPGPKGGALSVDALERDLGEMGFARPDMLAARVRGWSDGRYRALRSPAAIEAFDAILPALLEALATAPDPDRALIRWESVLGKLSSAINLFRLLEARPALLDRLVRILTLADPLAEDLARKPALLDILIDQSALDLPGPVTALEQAMTLDDPDYEGQLDRIRIVTGEKRFALGVQLIEAVHDPLDIAAGLSRLAEASLAVAQRACEREYAHTHGRIAGSELVTIGLGRFGGGMLTHASDLDMIYLFSGSHDGESDGRRPLGATLYFNRLAQRVSGALSVPTAQGALYEVDTRLRPQGAQGPLAVSIEAFERYQRADAWTWEHMALTRARVLTGSDQVRSTLDALIADVLAQPRDREMLRTDVLAMRADMAAHKAPKGPLDAKLLRGGLVDLEFLVHFLQLRERTGFDPDLGVALKHLAEAGLVPASLPDAYAMMARLLVAARLLAPELGPPPAAASDALARACGMGNLDALLRLFTEARTEVAAAWHAIFGLTLEIDG